MPSATPIEFKRHYHRLSPKEMDGVVDAVAGLIVNFLMSRPGRDGGESRTQATGGAVPKSASRRPFNE